MKDDVANATTAINIQYIQRDIAEMKQNMKEMLENFVTKQEFDPIKTLAVEGRKESGERIEKMEKTIAMWAGGILLLAFIIPFILKLVFKW